MIDVLLPFYGDPALMVAAVRSVLSQRTSPSRLIVLDDCYPDLSVGSWLQGLDDPRVTYIRNDRNLGANANYRKALALSKAKYVVFMGADDVMLPGFVERAGDLIQQFDEPDVIQGGVGVIDASGARHMPLGDRVKNWCRPQRNDPQMICGQRAAVSLLRGNWAYFPSLVWRREAITQIGFRQGFHVVQDLALLIDVLTAGGRMVLDSQETFEYRRHAGSDSSIKTGSGSRFDEEREYFQVIRGELLDLGWTSAAMAARVHTTSRLHAASKLPETVGSRDWQSASRVLGHVLG